jgi:sugar-specific transcriptional regulator TrmB
MPNYSVLRKIGLSKTAAECYAALAQHGGANAEQLATRLDVKRTGLYRVLNRLEKQGFIVSVKSELQPKYYYAEPLDVALEKYFKYQIRLVRRLLPERRRVY